MLSDRYLEQGKIPVHALLATGAVHHHLVEAGLRCDANIIVETGVARDPHHCRLPDRLRRHHGLSVPRLPVAARNRAARQARASSSSLVAATDAGFARGCSRSCRRWAFRPSRVIVAHSCSKSSACIADIVEKCFKGTTSRIQGSELRGSLSDQKATGGQPPGIRDCRFEQGGLIQVRAWR